MPRLHVVPPQGRPFVHPFEGDSLTVGRASEADLTVADRYLSREHARLFRDGDRLLIEDLGSYNGTFLNDRTVKAPTEVWAGDTIRLSGVVITLLEEEWAEPPSGSTETVFRGAREILRSASATAAPPEEPASQELRTYVERLRVLNEVHQALARPLGLEELLELILDRVFEHMKAEEGAIFLLDEEGEPYRAASRTVSAQELLYSRSLVEEVIHRGMGALVTDANTDSRFASAQSIVLSGVRSIVAAPLLDPEGVKGMIALSSSAQVRNFSEGDLELLVSLAAVAALHVRNVSLLEEVVAGRRLEEEIRLARQIQVKLLPRRLPDLEGYELRGGNLPSRTVSGDYYVIVERAEGAECVLMVVDVSGKGIAASLLTASLEALAAGLIEVGQPPEEICRLASGQLHARTPPEKYATAFVAALDVADSTLRYTNAGHNAALLIRRSGDAEELRSTGPPVGLLPGASFEAAEVTLESRDLLVIYTDGITEATNREDEEYGLERFAALCTGARELPLPEIARRIEEDLLAFASGAPFADDRTLVLLRRLPGDGD